MKNLTANRPLLNGGLCFIAFIMVTAVLGALKAAETILILYHIEQRYTPMTPQCVWKATCLPAQCFNSNGTQQKLYYSNTMVYQRGQLLQVVCLVFTYSTSVTYQSLLCLTALDGYFELCLRFSYVHCIVLSLLCDAFATQVR